MHERCLRWASMSFIPSAFAAHPLHTREEYASTAMQLAQQLGFTDWRGAAVCAVMAMFQEAGAEDDNGVRQIWCPGNHADPCYDANPNAYPHDSESDDGQSSGPLQQQMNAPGTTPWGWGGAYGDCAGTAARMDMVKAITMFYSWPGSGLKFKAMDARNAQSANDSIQRVQGSGVPNAYGQWWNMANALIDQVIKGGVAPPTGGIVVTAPAKPAFAPDYNEYGVWSDNNEDRTALAAIDLWLIHTEDGSETDNADALAHFLKSTEGTTNPRSYHYTISESYEDHGVTVCDVVDTNQAAWSVGNSNNRTINLCFAGSKAAWTRAQWLAQSRAIDVAAFLCAQDCIKYPSLRAAMLYPVPGGSYSGPPPGISDHRYCTAYLHDGNNHTDVDGPTGPYGPPYSHFPWDVFGAAVAKWTALLLNQALPGAPAPNVPVIDPSQYTSYLYDQVCARWEMFGWRTQAEQLALVGDKVLGTSHAGKPGFKRGAPPDGVDLLVP